MEMTNKETLWGPTIKDMNNIYKRQIRPMYYSPGDQGFSDTYDPIIFKGEEWHDEGEMEEIKKALEPVIKDKDSWGSLKFDERFVPVDKSTIETMCKYQKIKKIIDDWDNQKINNIICCLDIKEVIEDEQ